jgi:hypothetical protein
MRFSGEPELRDILSDPIVEALMRADGWDRRAVCAELLSAKAATAQPRDRTPERCRD